MYLMKFDEEGKKISAVELSMINKHLNSINLQGARYPQSQENLIDK
jgi:hypothetical protein